MHPAGVRRSRFDGGSGVRAASDGVGQHTRNRLHPGDNVYPDGTATQYRNCYDPTWGKYKKRTKPTVGNHEYHTTGASGYFNYFGARAGTRGKGYYSYDRGAWHLVALNSNCDKVGGCGINSPQGRWLRNDFANNPSRCTLAYWHHPLYASGTGSDAREVKPFWNILYNRGAEIIPPVS
jgi:hypothetical protein